MKIEKHSAHKNQGRRKRRVTNPAQMPVQRRIDRTRSKRAPPELQRRHRKQITARNVETVIRDPDLKYKKQKMQNKHTENNGLHSRPLPPADPQKNPDQCQNRKRRIKPFQKSAEKSGQLFILPLLRLRFRGGGKNLQRREKRSGRREKRSCRHLSRFLFLQRCGVRRLLLPVPVGRLRFRWRNRLKNSLQIHCITSLRNRIANRLIHVAEPGQ